MNILTGNRLKKGIPATLLLAILPFLIMLILGNDYGVMLSCIILIYVMAVSGLDMLFGYTGQISMGHAAFFCIGAYTSGMLNNYFGIPLFVTIPVGAVVSTLLGALLAYPASKLKFHFLTLATIAFGEIIYNLLYVSPGGVTGDFLGLSVNGIGFLSSYTAWYYFLLVITVIALLAKISLVKSRVGRALTAIRENTHAADGMGVDVRKYKIIAFALSAFYTGLAGALFVHFIGYISPETCMLQQSILFMTMLMFGGSGSLWGPITGVVVIELLLEVFRPLQEYQMLFYGVLLLIVIVVLPGGLYGGVKGLIANPRKKANGLKPQGKE